MGNYINEIHRINYLNSEITSLYHLSSLKLGITDSVSIVLYSMYDAGGECLLSEVYKTSGISKQTVNSAVRRLENEGIIYLEHSGGKMKKLVLTEKGRSYVQKTTARLYQAEMDAFDTWSETEIESYIRLMEKYNDCFRRQIEKL